MNRIINNIQFKRNLTYMLNKQKCNTTFRFSKYTNMFFFSGSLLTKIHQPINFVYHQNETMSASKYSLKETTLMVRGE